MTIAWRLKKCPRCGGDIFIDRDMDIWYEQCLQCSYSYEINNPFEPKEQRGLIQAGAKDAPRRSSR